MKLSDDDLEQIRRYRALDADDAFDAPEAKAFLARLPRRLQDEVLRTIDKGIRMCPTIEEAEWIPDAAVPALYPDGPTWKEQSLVQRVAQRRRLQREYGSVH
jgi:hypothetical protein